MAFRLAYTGSRGSPGVLHVALHFTVAPPRVRTDRRDARGAERYDRAPNLVRGSPRELITAAEPQIHVFEDTR